jgi:hypothetical protein
MFRESVGEISQWSSADRELHDEAQASCSRCRDRRRTRIVHHGVRRGYGICGSGVTVDSRPARRGARRSTAAGNRSGWAGALGWSRAGARWAAAAGNQSGWTGALGWTPTWGLAWSRAGGLAWSRAGRLAWSRAGRLARWVAWRPLGRRTSAVGVGTAAATGMGWTAPAGVGAGAAAIQLLGVQRPTGVGPGFQPVGLLVLRDLDPVVSNGERKDRDEASGASWR